MSQVDAIFQAIEFMEANLKQEISIADAASQAGYSLYHFCRLFNALTHHTPYDYLVRRRLSGSARELAETRKKIVDIAFAYRFNNAETFSRAFKRLSGLQPKQWRRIKPRDRRLLMHRINRSHLLSIQQGDYLKPSLEDRPAFQVIGLMSRISNDRHAVIELWEALAGEIKAHLGSQQRLGYCGVQYYPQTRNVSSNFYMAAIVAESADFQSTPLVAKTFPPLRLAAFPHQGPAGRLELARDYIYHTWLPRSGERLGPAFDIEFYSENPALGDPERIRTTLYIPLGC